MFKSHYAKKLHNVKNDVYLCSAARYCAGEGLGAVESEVAERKALRGFLPGWRPPTPNPLTGRVETFLHSFDS